MTPGRAPTTIEQATQVERIIWGALTFSQLLLGAMLGLRELPPGEPIHTLDLQLSRRA